MSDQLQEKIHESVDKVQPREGARERMLANVLRKAEEAAEGSASESEKIGARLPKRLLRFALPAAACLALVLFGIWLLPQRNTLPTEDPTDMMAVNPYRTVNGAAVFEEELGIRLKEPEGAEEISYSILNGEIANISFKWASHTFRLRASGQTEDFSGLNGEEEVIETVDEARAAVLSAVRDEDLVFYKLSWKEGDVTYLLINTDGAAPEVMREIYGMSR